jgi:hypothetical protein
VLGKPLLSLLSCLILSGCAYTLGPTNNQTAGAKSIKIQPFVNAALEPRLSEYVVNSIRKNIQRDGTFRLETGSDSDIIVTGTILKFERNELSFQPGDVITPRDYRVSIVAQITALERITGKLLVSRAVTGYSSVRFSKDLPNADLTSA